MTLTQTLQSYQARETSGLLAIALVGALIPSAICTNRDVLIAGWNESAGRRIEAGVASSNSVLQVETTGLNELLAVEITKVFGSLTKEQRELDVNARRALYGNLKRLYLK